MSFVDPYFDPEIGDLRNLLGAQSTAQLRELEPQAVFANELELSIVDIPRTNDLKELRALHAQLFKGVYDWAGHIRTVDIRKHRENAGFFLPVAFVERAAGFVFHELANENDLKGLSRDEFVRRLAHFYDQLNYIHPFREGNGRTQRVFWRRVAGGAGFTIDWSKVIGEENDLACRVAMEQHNLTPLVEMFHRITKKTGD
ncbi:MAG: Fic family protein [Propionibacteriaceae bacterium]|jgi:cell filamentation protein|nr:Fic family protein [Propionibacteriaceae bacterium]